MSATHKRLLSDLATITKNPPVGISAEPADDNLFEWNAIIFGPGDTPFEGGIFRLRMTFPPNYPAKAPIVFFFSKMFHPNVYKNGKICIDILEEESKWNPVYDAATVLSAIQAMLGDPNPMSPANGVANDLFRNNTKEYEQRVRQMISLSEHEDDLEGVGEIFKNMNLVEVEEEEERNQQAIAMAMAELNG